MVWYSYYTIYLANLKRYSFHYNQNPLCILTHIVTKREWGGGEVPFLVHNYHRDTIRSRQRSVVRVIVMTYPPSKSPKKKMDSSSLVLVHLNLVLLLHIEEYYCCYSLLFPLPFFHSQCAMLFTLFLFLLPLK